VCMIVLFRAVIILFVVVEIVLVVDICCTSVVSTAPICTSSRSICGPPSPLTFSTNMEG
jgi:hypothetical protein